MKLTKLSEHLCFKSVFVCTKCNLVIKFYENRSKDIDTVYVSCNNCNITYIQCPTSYAIYEVKED